MACMQVKGEKGESEPSREWQQMQARVAGRREERKILAGVGCGQHPGGWSSMTGEEVGSR